MARTKQQAIAAYRAHFALKLEEEKTKMAAALVAAVSIQAALVAALSENNPRRSLRLSEKSLS